MPPKRASHTNGTNGSAVPKPRIAPGQYDATNADFRNRNTVLRERQSQGGTIHSVDELPDKQLRPIALGGPDENPFREYIAEVKKNPKMLAWNGETMGQLRHARKIKDVGENITK